VGALPQLRDRDHGALRRDREPVSRSGVLRPRTSPTHVTRARRRAAP
jgi:hypothetical protein